MPGSDCLLWIGPYDKNDQPVAHIDYRRISALGMAWVVDGGALADGPFVRTCRTCDCVNVNHIRRRVDDPLLDENAYGERLEDGFRMLSSGEDEDLSDCE